MKGNQKKNPTTNDSIWSPFRYPIFRMLWISSLISNIGTWMHDVGAAWLMTTLTNSPIWVSLVQAMAALSIFLLALPAGALADILDRRLYLIFLQAFMMIVAGALAIATFFGKISPELLLFLTFFLGAGTALSMPTWLALISELVPPKELSSAVTLTGLTINFARFTGPVLAGLIIAAYGPAAVFAINALSFFGIIISLFGWQRTPSDSLLPAERLFGAMRAGIRYVRGSPALQTLFVKSSAFFVFASGVWALLPLVARINLSSGPIGYGVLFAFFGMGAIIGALLLPRFREKLGCDTLIVLGATGFAVTAFTLSLSSNFYFACGGMMLGGTSWTVVLATLITVVQQVVASWVRARALSIFLAIFFGAMAVGSILWGWIASHFTISIALFVSAMGLLIANYLAYIFTSSERLILDFTPSGHLPAPHVEEELKYEQGPVMITIEYFVSPQQTKNFSRVMRDLRRIRLREGAFFWSLFQDVEDTKKFVECFMVDSWLEHLRQHERISISDREVQDKAGTFHEGKDPPQVTHFIAYDVPKK
jgi:MFS family permease